MQSFAEIKARAEKRKGGADALAALLADADAHRGDIAQLTDDRILSEFSKRIFQAGFNWQVVENKWDGFEEAFHGFDIPRNAMMRDEDLDSHLKNTAIIRNAAKILSIRDNAIFLSDLAQEHGSAVGLLSKWPLGDQIGLLALLKKRGSRLGGMTGQYALRFLGRDCFILSSSVVAALKIAGVIDGPATSQKALKAVQDAFNDWHAESGESFARISRTLALSVDTP